jgi:hypothetical protein
MNTDAENLPGGQQVPVLSPITRFALRRQPLAEYLSMLIHGYPLVFLKPLVWT